MAEQTLTIPGLGEFKFDDTRTPGAFKCTSVPTTDNDIVRLIDLLGGTLGTEGSRRYALLVGGN